jgi:hypothetical protein
MTPRIYDAVERAKRAGFVADYLRHDPTGRVEAIACPGCGVPVFGRVKVGKPVSHELAKGPKGETVHVLHWDTVLTKLPSARTVTVSLGSPEVELGGMPSSFTRLTYCAPCADRLQEDPDALRHALAIEAHGHAQLLLRKHPAVVAEQHGPALEAIAFADAAVTDVR